MDLLTPNTQTENWMLLNYTFEHLAGLVKPTIQRCFPEEDFRKFVIFSVNPDRAPQNLVYHSADDKVRMEKVAQPAIEIKEGEETKDNEVFKMRKELLEDMLVIIPIIQGEFELIKKCMGEFRH